MHSTKRNAERSDTVGSDLDIFPIWVEGAVNKGHLRQLQLPGERYQLLTQQRRSKGVT